MFFKNTKVLYIHQCFVQKYLNLCTKTHTSSYFEPVKLGKEEIKEIIDKAKFIKKIGVKDSNIRKFFCDKRVAIFCSNRPTSITTQIFLWAAAQSFQTTIMPVFLEWHHLKHKADIGRMLEMNTDIVLMDANYCADIHEMASECQIPIIHGSCGVLQPLQGLSNLMTIEEHFGKTQNLTFAWIGPGHRMLNTYMLLLPKFGMNINFNCCANPDLKVSPMMYPDCSKLSKHHHTKLQSFTSPEEAVKGAHVIATTQHARENQKITMKILEKADPNWIFLHDMPRGENEVDDEVFRHSKSFVWKNFDNMIYIVLAVMQYNLEKCTRKSATS